MSFTSLRSTAIGLAASLMLLATVPVKAATITFNGAFSGDTDVQYFQFVVGAVGITTLKTTSYANLGGFDPVLTLYSSSGSFITFADDDGGLGFDSLLNENLAPGTYKLALSQSPYYDLGDGFEFFPSSITSTADFGCPALIFCNVAGEDRKPLWTVVFSHENENGIVSAEVLAQTPIPAALPLFATGLGAIGLLAYRRRRKAAAV